MKRKDCFLLIFSLLAALLLTAPAGASDGSGGTPVRAVVLYDGDADPRQLEQALRDLEDVEFLWPYSALFSGAAVEAGEDGLLALQSLPGVSAVGLARTYMPASAGGSAWPDGGLELMGADKLLEDGYTGDGILIAVLDSGLNVDHEAFADASLVRSPSLSKEDVDAFAAKGGTKGRYVSERIPFAYDYYGKDTDLSTSNRHGTHVTALAAGYANGGETFRGVAPGAQILGMKLFPDNSSGGTDETIILRALEDAWNLGADVVNLSIGMGAGFSQDEVMDGIFCRAFAQMAESGVIICCAAGNENTAVTGKKWAAPLPTAAYTDYGSVCSPGSYLGCVPVAAAGKTAEGKGFVAAYSSWGPASGLHIDPALTAFGGPAVSANATSNDTYRTESGTSMASPNAAGAFAVLLQALREQGVTDKVQASLLAQGLLESTARILTGKDGVPTSPRKQGAGLLDLSAAVSSQLVVMNPLLEAGDSADGRFTLKMTLLNLSQSALTVSLDAVALTDAYEKREDGVYSALTARDISGSVAVGGSRSVTVPANGTAAATLTLAVSPQLKRELSEIFTNGFFVEGYVTASGGGQEAHATFLGYCGDWEAAPVLEPLDFHDAQDALYRLAVQAGGGAKLDYLGELKPDAGVNLAFLTDDVNEDAGKCRLVGANGHAYATHDAGRNAMPSQDTDAMVTAGGNLCLELYALRDAAGVVALVSDQETGEVYYAEDATWMIKSLVSLSGKGIDSAVRFNWDAAGGDGAPLPGGTKVRVDVYAWLQTDGDIQAAYAGNVRRGTPQEYGWLLEDAYADYRELSFPLVVDGAAPTVSAAMRDGAVTLTIRDDQYVAYAAVGDKDGRVLAEEAFFPTSAGSPVTLTVDLSGYEELPETIYIQAEDYASNLIGYELDLSRLAGGKSASPERCAMTLLGDVRLSAWYHEAVDFIVDRGVMQANDRMAFRPDKKVTRSEVISALYAASGSPEPGLTVKDLPFSDATGRLSYLDALCWAYENHLVSGRSDGAFGGGDSVTRQELAVMLYRYAQLGGSALPAGSLAGVPDAGNVADWAREAMAWAVGQGVMQASESGQLLPGYNISRAETAQILMRFLIGQ